MDDDRRNTPPVYGEYRVGGRVFVVRFTADGVPDFPHFESGERDEAGRPYAFACNEACAFFDGGARNPGVRLCCDCIYLRGDPIGLCTCAMNERGDP